MDKRESEIRHAIRRARERYRVKLVHADLDSMVHQIITNRSEFVRKESNARTIHNIKFHGVKMRVVYDKFRKCIVTFLHVRK